MLLHLGLMIPLGSKWKSYSRSSTTTVCPALLPPCKTHQKTAPGFMFRTCMYGIYNWMKLEWSYIQLCIMHYQVNSYANHKVTNWQQYKTCIDDPKCREVGRGKNGDVQEKRRGKGRFQMLSRVNAPIYSFFQLFSFLHSQRISLLHWSICRSHLVCPLKMRLAIEMSISVSTGYHVTNQELEQFSLPSICIVGISRGYWVVTMHWKWW